VYKINKECGPEFEGINPGPKKSKTFWWIKLREVFLFLGRETLKQ
jgi:hypothetical protein